jgi:glycosyltransferase involved in cell wall biosynthesis
VPAVSVVIPARNAEREIVPTLEALAAVETVVAVNGSSDATADVARAHGATVVVSERASRSAARNLGAAAAGGEHLLFTDAACVPEPGWAERLAACLGDAPLAGGPVRVTTSAKPGAAERFDALWRFQQERAVREGGWSAAANLGVTRDAFAQLGGFDERLTAGDDVDICVRARRAGLAIGWCPDAEVAHPASRTVSAVCRRALRQGFSSTVLARRFEGDVGRRHWRHPGGVVRGRAALRALGVEPDSLDVSERRRMAMLARLDYAGRYAGSLWAQLTWREG